MSEPLAADIVIGGPLKRRHLPRLIKAIRKAGVGQDWGDPASGPKDEHDLKKALDENNCLWLCDDQAPWGEFRELEALCRKLGLSYSRHCEGKYEYDPELVDWRPGMKKPLVRMSSNANRTTFVPVDDAHTVLKYLEAGEYEKVVRAIRKLSPNIPPVPPFKIV